MNTKKFIRLELSNEAYESLDQMISQVNQEKSYCKVSRSNLVSYCINSFFKNLFDKEKSVIINSHFDSKKFVKNALNNLSSNTDIESFLQDTLKQVASSKPRKKRKRGISNITPE